MWSATTGGPFGLVERCLPGTYHPWHGTFPRSQATVGELARRPAGRMATSHPVAQRAGWIVASALCALLVSFALLGGTVGFAKASLPGDLIYPAKLASEEIQLALAVRQATRAERHLSRVALRAEEMCRSTHNGRPIYEATVVRMKQSLKASVLAAASANSDQTARLLAAIEVTTAEQLARLTAVEAVAAHDDPYGTWDTRQLLSRAHHDLQQARALARVGQADVSAFRLNTSLLAFQIGEPIETFPGRDASTGTAIPTTQPSSPIQGLE